MMRIQKPSPIIFKGLQGKAICQMYKLDPDAYIKTVLPKTATAQNTNWLADGLREARKEQLKGLVKAIRDILYPKQVFKADLKK